MHGQDPNGRKYTGAQTLLRIVCTAITTQMLAQRCVVDCPFTYWLPCVKLVRQEALKAACYIHVSLRCTHVDA